MAEKLMVNLTSTWQVPTYAQEQLWVECDGGIVQCQGENGQFEVLGETSSAIIRWGDKDGPALLEIPWQVESLDWDGSVRIGGYLDGIHVTALHGMSITVLFAGGQPLSKTQRPYPMAAFRRNHIYRFTDFHDGLVAELQESFTTWLIPEDSPLDTLAHEAMTNNLRLHLWGKLADDESGWGMLFALPIVLEGITVFAP